ncbi:MAG: chemotaxis protein CheW, partial [Candidatus Electrothrix sp. ATG1]|nr:chemotaxis protein CheW [Candidatus Electrothrix sp. ATG1]
FLVVDIGTPVGFMVDQVSHVIDVAEEQIDTDRVIDSSIEHGYVRAVIKDVDQYEMVMILDFEHILKTELEAMLQYGKELAAQTRAVVMESQEEEQEEEDELHLFSFEIAEQEYAIEVDCAKGIVRVPEEIIHLPKAASHILGMVTIRNQLLPLVSLRQLFDLQSDQELSQQKRIVIVSLRLNNEELRVGLVTDTVKDVLRVPQNSIEEMPTFLRHDREMAGISSVCRLDGDKRLVSILSVEKLFTHDKILDAVKAAQEMKEELSMSDQQAEENETSEDIEQFILFRLLDDEYGVSIESAKEIVRVPDKLTHVPKAPPFIEGTINLRGTVLPVINERVRLGLPKMEKNDRQRIMVIVINGIKTGFIVDSVTEVMHIRPELITEVPATTVAAQRLVPRMANIEDQERMIMLLNVEELFDLQETDALNE